MSDDYDLTSVHYAEPVFGMQMGTGVLRTHGASACAGRACCIHNPSAHHMRGWEMNWRGDLRVMERICPCHGVGHPDPDDVAYRRLIGRGGGTHGCHGCCHAGHAPDDGTGHSMPL